MSKSMFSWLVIVVAVQILIKIIVVYARVITEVYNYYPQNIKSILSHFSCFIQFLEAPPIRTIIHTNVNFLEKILFHIRP